jgi:hypothetical protein
VHAFNSRARSSSSLVHLLLMRTPFIYERPRVLFTCVRHYLYDLRTRAFYLRAQVIEARMPFIPSRTFYS